MQQRRWAACLRESEGEPQLGTGCEDSRLVGGHATKRLILVGAERQTQGQPTKRFKYQATGPKYPVYRNAGHLVLSSPVLGHLLLQTNQDHQQGQNSLV